MEPSSGSDVGIDFGTTNTSVARVDADGALQLARFPVTASYRSLLYLEKNEPSWSGPEAIERYLAADVKGRLIQSLKSFLSSRTLRKTEIFGRPVALEDLIARILRNLREEAERQFGTPIRTATAGRPVHFVGAENEDDNLFAESRLREAFRMAGFEAVQFQLEPVAAARFYDSTLQRDELILIGDFGGGTSDFSLVRVGPSGRALLGNAGLALAGDAFDAQIIRHLVSPALGAGTRMHSMGKSLPVPAWVYMKLERWHHLSLLKSRETRNMLVSVRAQAEFPERIASLQHLIEEDEGYQLHRAVQKLKFQLSDRERGEFDFADGVIHLRATVNRSDFEQWISGELVRIETCVDGLLSAAHVLGHEVDRVFLTGGSSFVPAVRRIFETRFGAARLSGGDEFTSVAAGLALGA